MAPPGLLVAPTPDHERPPRGSRRQYTVIEDQVDVRTRRQRREALQQFDRVEQQMGRPVRPAAPELEPVASAVN